MYFIGRAKAKSDIRKQSMEVAGWKYTQRAIVIPSRFLSLSLIITHNIIRKRSNDTHTQKNTNRVTHRVQQHKHNVQMHSVTHRNCLFLGEEEEEEEENEEEREAVSFSINVHGTLLVLHIIDFIFMYVTNVQTETKTTTKTKTKGRKKEKSKLFLFNQGS